LKFFADFLALHKVAARKNQLQHLEGIKMKNELHLNKAKTE